MVGFKHQAGLGLGMGLPVDDKGSRDVKVKYRYQLTTFFKIQSLPVYLREGVIAEALEAFDDQTSSNMEACAFPS